ncbi:hypothetical protein CVT26_000060 [Gymnopilus dilepis]|uniref:Major facilitator superfamily (MFS) profile domain-containing protein n=1 Tax=Gymnopilus dilepis TaxID=231916 RepID=A0A409VGI7_9AGAR|nr:hypothetical protein CVT26_000060 [Gymnopilus dilepis]
MRTKAVHLLAIFILVYVGVEVTIGGSSTLAGLTTGRVALLWLNNKEKGVRSSSTQLSRSGMLSLEYFEFHAADILYHQRLEIIIWFVPSLIGNAVAVSIVGVLLGPMYPIVMNQSSRILPRWILTGSIGWIAGFGQAGSALFPFLTGAISAKKGIKSLQPL